MAVPGQDGDHLAGSDAGGPQPVDQTGSPGLLSSERVSSVNSSMMASPSGSASAISRICSATPASTVVVGDDPEAIRSAKLTPMADERAHWFEAVADHLGAAYLRYSFTKGTDQEVDFLVDCLGLAPGARILDVGCGPGRHAHEFGRRGFEVVGVDISERFVALAREGHAGRRRRRPSNGPTPGRCGSTRSSTP